MTQMRFDKRLWRRFAWVWIALWMCPRSYALDVSLLGTMTLSNANLKSSSSSGGGESKLNGGVGATLGFDLSPFWSLETGAIYVKHSLNRLTSYTLQELTMSQVKIPLWLRFSPLPFVVVNGGVYAGLSLANQLETTTSVNANSVTSPNKKNDAGLLAGVGVRWPILPLIKLRADLFYEFGLVNLNILTDEQKSRNLDLFVGVMLDVW